MNSNTRTTTLEDFAYLNHNSGAAAVAAKRIAAGETISFNVFRRSATNSRIMVFVATHYFGLSTDGRQTGVRISHCKDLEALDSFALIASWYEQAKDPVFIAAELTRFLLREGTDFFINTD